MTENQEKELFLILGRLVSGISEIQLDIREIKGTLAEHSVTLDRHSTTLDNHTVKLDRLESKIDSVASPVVENDKRVSTKIDVLEHAVEDLGGKVH